MVDETEQTCYKVSNPVIWRWEAKAFGGPRWGPFLFCSRPFPPFLRNPQSACAVNLTLAVACVLPFFEHRHQPPPVVRAPRSSFTEIERGKERRMSDDVGEL